MRYQVLVVYNVEDINNGHLITSLRLCEGFTILLRDKIVLLQNVTIQGIIMPDENSPKEGNSFIVLNEEEVKRIIITDDENHVLFYWGA